MSAEWFWRSVHRHEALLDDGELETGEPPRRLPHIFAESMNTYAEHGDDRLVDHVAAPARVGPLRRNYKIARCEGITPEIRPMVEEIWSRLPRFNDLVRRAS